jgi:hypothetical protein
LQHGSGLYLDHARNVPAIRGEANQLRLDQIGQRIRVRRIENVAPVGAMLANPSGSQYAPRPYPNYSDITITEYDGYSNYNAVQLNASHRGSRYFWAANYTFSKVLGDSVTQIDPFTPGNNYGPLNFDVAA